MENINLRAWSEIGAVLVGLVGGTLGVWFQYKSSKNKAILKLEIKKINKACKDADELEKNNEHTKELLKEEQESHAKTKRRLQGALANIEVVYGQLSSIQDIWHCLDPVWKKKLADDPEVLMVLERLTKVLNMDNTDLGRE